MGCCESALVEEEEVGFKLLPKKRECTDIFFLVLFLGCFLTTIVLAIVYIPETDLQVLSVAHNSVFDDLSIIKNLNENTHSLMISFAFSFVLSFSLVLIMRWVSEGLVTFLSVALTVTQLGLVIYAWILYGDYGTSEGLALGIVITILFVLWILFIIFAARKVKLVLMLYGESSSVLRQMPQLLLVGVLVIACKAVVLIILFIAICVILSSLLHNKIGKYDPGPKITIEDDGKAAAYGFLVITCLWTYNFLTSCRIYLVGNAAAMWYFEWDKADVRNPVTTGFVLLIGNHTGTLFFGSFLSTIFQVLLIILQVLKLLKSKSRILKIITVPAQAIVGCCSSFVHFLTVNAYYITVLQGFGFCKAAKRAMDLIKVTESLFIHMITDVIRFGCVILVFALTLFLSTFTIKEPNFVQSWPSYVVTAILAYLVPSSILSIFKDITETIYMCLCIDIEQNDGLLNPYYMSDGLTKYVSGVKATKKRKRTR